MTRQSLGRRVVKTAPQESLILLKPTGAIEHGGGVRFDTGSLEYRVISEWIAAGMPGPSASDPEIRGLTVYPTAVRLAPGQIPAGAGAGDVFRRPSRGRDPLGQVRQHGRRGRLGGRRRAAQGHRPGRGVCLGLVRQPGRAHHRDVAVRDEARSEGVRLGDAEQPDRREEPRQAGVAADPAVARCRRRRLPPPRLPRCHRHAADRRAGRGVPRRPRPESPRPAGRSTAPEPGICGLLGLQVVGHAAGLVAEAAGAVDVVVLPLRAARAWRRTCRGTGSPARS